MASLRSAAASALRSSSVRPTLSLRAPVLARYESDGAAKPRAQSASGLQKPPSGSMGHGVVRRENPAQGEERHKPDYNVAVDYRTS
jgi:NADH dehydrogenase (ubiquinone) Fe-S protein 4